MEYYSTRTNDSSRTGVSYWEDTDSGYQLVCDFPINDPDYLHRFAIDNHGVYIDVSASFGRGVFVFITGDTIPSEKLKSPAQGTDVAIPGKIFNIPKALQDKFNAMITLKRIKKKNYIEKITIDITKEVGDIWFERYCKFRVQTSFA